MPVKKTAATKRKTAKKTAPAKKSTAKKAPATKKSVKEVKKPAGKRGGFHREMNPDTGFVVGTDQDAIALALLEGGDSRAAIVESLENELDTETRNGTEKQITNMVSGVLNKMLANGFTVESSFVVVPPTAASKRAATRAATKKSAPAKKTAAKKSSAKGRSTKKGRK
jgi:hypothetical protein